MVLVTGGAGYIGSHTCVELLTGGYEVLIADNLSNSSEVAVERVAKISGKAPEFVNIDLTDEPATLKLFEHYPQIDSVIHFAALKAVGESVEKPLEYYKNNINCTLSLLNAMRKFKVNKFIFSSSATVYGLSEDYPYREDSPTSALNPYGYTKLVNERILADYCRVNPEFCAVLLRYFNPIGAHKSGLIGEDPRGIPNNLLPIIAQVAVGKLEKLKVTGNDYATPDGTGIRDYVHVVDLALGHIAALNKLDERGSENCLIYNLGTGKGYSVLEVLAAYEKACGFKIAFEFAPRRPGDSAVSYADTAKAAKELSWSAKLGIDDMCSDSWNWQKNNPDGYR